MIRKYEHFYQSVTINNQYMVLDPLQVPCCCGLACVTHGGAYYCLSLPLSPAFDNSCICFTYPRIPLNSFWMGCCAASSPLAFCRLKYRDATEYAKETDIFASSNGLSSAAHSSYVRSVSSEVAASTANKVELSCSKAAIACSGFGIL